MKNVLDGAVVSGARDGVVDGTLVAGARLGILDGMTKFKIN